MFKGYMKDTDNPKKIIQNQVRLIKEFKKHKYKVIIVSPTSFLAYLQTVLQGLKALSIEKKAEEIQKRVGELGKHLQTYEGYMQKLGNTLGTTVNHYNAAYKELGKVDKDILRITEESPGFEPEVLVGPEKDN